MFDAGLPTVEYDHIASPAEVYPQLLAAQRLAPVALGPAGPEILSYDLVRTVLRDNRFQVPPGYILAAQGITSGPLWDKVVKIYDNPDRFDITRRGLPPILTSARACITALGRTWPGWRSPKRSTPSPAGYRIPAGPGRRRGSRSSDSAVRRASPSPSIPSGVTRAPTRARLP